ncbi:hypothetical protein D3C81_1881860 [compost metagenome]
MLGNVLHAGAFQARFGKLTQRPGEDALFQADRVVFAFGGGDIIIVQHISHLSFGYTG